MIMLIALFRMLTGVRGIEIIERLRCEQYAKLVYSNHRSNVTVTHREVKSLSSGIMIDETLREMTRVQRLRQSK